MSAYFHPYLCGRKAAEWLIMMNNPFLSAPKHKKALTLIGLYLGIVASLLNSSSTSVILPIAAMEIGGQDIYPLVNVIGNLLICAMPVYGFFCAKNPGYKRPLICISFVVGAVVLFTRAIAQSMLLIVGMTFFYSLFSAAIYVVGFSMIRDLYEGKEAGFYLGLVGTFMSVGMLLGPVINGALIDLLGWRAICHIIWILMMIACGFLFFGVNVKPAEAKHLGNPSMKFDFLGAVFLVLFLIGLLLPLSFGKNYIPYGTPLNYALLGLALVSLIVLVCDFRKKKGDAIIPTTVLKNRNVLILSCSSFFLTFSSMAIFFFLSSYIIYVMGGSALEASLTAAAMNVLGLIIGPVFGRNIAKTGNARNLLVIGTIVRIAITIAFIVLLSPTTPLWVLVVLMLLAGFYNSQQSVTFSTAPQIQIPAELRAQGNSVIQFSQNLGSSAGMLVYTMIIGMGLEAGFPIALWVAVAAAVLVLAISFFLQPLPETIEGK